MGHGATGRRVLVVVDPDAAIHRRIANAVRSDQFDVVPCTTARGGLNACIALEPDCLVSELDLSDDGGLWLTQTIRELRTDLSCTPILLMSFCHRESTRVGALQSGADCFITKPFKDAEVAAQVGGLIGLASRVRARKKISIPRDRPGPRLVPHAASDKGRRPAAPPPPTASGDHIRGDLANISIPAILTALELEGRSGQLQLLHPQRDPLVLEIASGMVVGGRRGHLFLTALEAVSAALKWQRRRFEFVPGPARLAPENGLEVGKLVMLAIDLDARDESDELELHESLEELSPDRDDPSDRLPKGRIRSGTRQKAVVTASEDIALEAPGRSLIESMAPSVRPDPRIEEEEDDTTENIRSA